MVKHFHFNKKICQKLSRHKRRLHLLEERTADGHKIWTRCENENHSICSTFKRIDEQLISTWESTFVLTMGTCCAFSLPSQNNPSNHTTYCNRVRGGNTPVSTQLSKTNTDRYRNAFYSMKTRQV